MRGFQPMAMRGKAKPFANGGPVRGPGTGTSDEVADTVPNGTYIMPADSTQAVGEQQLAAMGGVPRGFAPANSAPQGDGVPVQLSNGEFKLPPEQVHAIGVQVLDQLKGATHKPVEERGFVPRGLQIVQTPGAGVDNGQQGAVRGFSPIGKREAVPKTFQGEPPLFFADGGVVTRGLPARGRYADGGQVGEEQKRSRSYGDAAAAALSPGVTQVSAPAPAPALQPAVVSTPASAAPSPGNTFPGNRLPSGSGATSAPASAPVQAGMTDAQRSAALAQIPMDTIPAPAPSHPTGADGAQPAVRGLRGLTPGIGRSGGSYADAAPAMSQPRGLPTAREPVQAMATAVTQPQASQVMPGVYRSGSSYSDTAAGAVAGSQPRGLPSPQNMAAADALAARSEQEAIARIASGQSSRGFAPGMQQFSAPQVVHSGNDWEARKRLENLATSASSITNTTRWGGRDAGGNPAVRAYRAALDSDAALQMAQPKMDQAALEANAGLQSAYLQQAGADRRTNLQQAFEAVRERRAAQHQANQDDIARQRLNLDTQKAGQVAIPSGYRARQDGRGLEFIPGGPADPGTSKEAAQQTKDAQDIFSIINQARPLLETTTGSAAGNVIDKVAGVFGQSPGGAESAAQLKALQGALVSKMPKMSGPQSDKDVQLYQEMAGRIGDPTVPVAQRKAAMKTVEDLNMKYLPVAADAGAYQALQSGAYYKTPDGTVRRKK